MHNTKATKKVAAAGSKKGTDSSGVEDDQGDVVMANADSVTAALGPAEAAEQTLVSTFSAANG